MTQVTLTQDEADARRKLLERYRRRGARQLRPPQHLLDFVLPRVRVEEYVDEAGTPLGECWIWRQGCSPSGTPCGHPDGRVKRVSIRRWVAQQMRKQPIPDGWVTLTDCGNDLCVHPACCQPMQRVKEIAIRRERRGGKPTEAMRRSNMLAGRKRSSLDEAKVQRLRDEHAAAVASGERLSLRELGQRYGISTTAAGDIVNGRRWAPGNLVVRRPVPSVFDLGRLA